MPENLNPRLFSLQKGVNVETVFMAEATPIDVQWATGNQQEVGQYGSKSRNRTMDASSVRLCGSTVENATAARRRDTWRS